jgi:hypothetical protein
MAERLGTDQGSVSRVENRDDMLLSTLADYLMATGADSAAIVVSVRGQEYVLDLTRFRARAGLNMPRVRRRRRTSRCRRSVSSQIVH